MPARHTWSLDSYVARVTPRQISKVYNELNLAREIIDRKSSHTPKGSATWTEEEREKNRVQTNKWRAANPERSKYLKREWARTQRLKKNPLHMARYYAPRKTKVSLTNQVMQSEMFIG